MPAFWWEGVHFFLSSGQGCVRWCVLGRVWESCLLMAELVFLSCLWFERCVFAGCCLVLDTGGGVRRCS